MLWGASSSYSPTGETSSLAMRSLSGALNHLSYKFLTHCSFICVALQKRSSWEVINTVLRPVDGEITKWPSPLRCTYSWRYDYYDSAFCELQYDAHEVRLLPSRGVCAIMPRCAGRRSHDDDSSLSGGVAEFPAEPAGN